MCVTGHFKHIQTEDILSPDKAQMVGHTKFRLESNPRPLVLAVTTIKYIK